MKRFWSIAIVSIGLTIVSVAMAKDRAPIAVPIEHGNSTGADLLHSGLTLIYVAEVTGEMVIQDFADELVKPVLEGYARPVFHPPAYRHAI